MNIQEIIHKRRYGRTRINYSNELYENLNELLILNGLKAEQEGLIQINFKQAMKIVSSLLNYGVAYKEEYMSIETAEKYTKHLFEGFNEQNCKCFTNGEWDKYYESDGFGFHGLTDSTIDGGVLISSKDLHFCFWIEEED